MWRADGSVLGLRFRGAERPRSHAARGNESNKSKCEYN